MLVPGTGLRGVVGRSHNPKTQIMTETEFPPVSFFLAPYGNLLLSAGAQGQRPRNHKWELAGRNFFTFFFLFGFVVFFN